jgi:AcrR family transcriptional regulator
MGRRSSHTAGELRELILDASTEIINEHGLLGLSAREIARRVRYSPGTIYNVFENLDDLILTIEGRLLDRLSARLAETPSDVCPKARLRALARVYLTFTHENPKLWNLLFEHHLPPSRTIPAWYQQKLEGLMLCVEQALRPLMPQAKPAAVQRAARVLWAGVHGITSLSTADKLSTITNEAAGSLIDELVVTFTAGLNVGFPAEVQGAGA